MVILWFWIDSAWSSITLIASASQSRDFLTLVLCREATELRWFSFLIRA